MFQIPLSPPIHHNAHMELISTAFIAAVFVLAGFVKGVVGLGLPTVAMGLLGLTMTPAEAAALLAVPSMATNIGQMFDGGPLRPLMRRLLPMLIAIAAGTAIGAVLLPSAMGSWATALLGLALAINASMNLLKVDIAIPAAREVPVSTAVGTVTGVVTITTGVFVMPLVPFLRALGMPRDDFVRALGLSFTVSSITLAVALAFQGVFTADVAIGSLLALAPALLGMWIGANLRQRLRGDLFKKIFDVSLLGLGSFLMLRAIF